MFFSRGSAYSSWASSTWSRASWVRARRGEDVEDHLAAVEHLHADRLFQVPHLGRGQVVVEDDHVGVGRLDQLGELVDLAGADVGGEVDVVALLGELADDLGAGGFGQAADFVARIVVDRPRPVGQGDRDEDRLLAADGELVPLGFERFADGMDSSWRRHFDPDALIVRASLGTADVDGHTKSARPQQTPRAGRRFAVRIPRLPPRRPPGRRLTFGIGRSVAGPVKTGFAWS